MAQRIFTFFLIIFATGISAFGQPPKHEVVKFPSADPFSIRPGTSFAASSAGRVREPAANSIIASSIVSDVDEALAVIQKNYVGSNPDQDGGLTKLAINSMLKTLDPHSTYFDKTEYQELIGEERSEYFGTGTTIVSYEKGGRLATFVLAAYPGSGAEKAGLKYGDRIVSIGSRNVTSDSSLVIRDLMRGPLGTRVRVGVERAGEILSFNLTRERIPQPTITNAFMLTGGTGVIEMPEGFSFSTYAEFDTAFKGLKTAGMTSLIIDLRGNPGGILEQSIKVAEKFLPFGSTIVSQRGRYETDRRVWRSSNRSPETLPLVVLVNSDSASASEVLAGALQDNDRALIVGEKTFGKGLVQSILDLPGKTGLALTTAKYYTPSGRSIQRDYSATGMYDYFNNPEHAADGTVHPVSYTVGKRKVFGGDGITPDVELKGETPNRTRVLLLDPIFYFGLEHPANFATESESFDAFLQFLKSGKWDVSSSIAAEERSFVLDRLKYENTLQLDGTAAADRSLLRKDSQILGAQAAIAKAQEFALATNPIRHRSLK